MKKLKVGEKIFHMNLNKIEQSEVKGVIIIEGDVEFKYDKFTTEPGKRKHIYMINAYSFVEESKAFKSKRSLLVSLSKQAETEDKLNF